jgi:cleavage and polyadenylation specificity factor subunit 3
MISFLSLGGSREIGANSYFLNLDGHGILLDSGLHPKKRNNEALPQYQFLENHTVDSLIISHAHLDHIGSIPCTLKRIPYLKPIMSYPTYHLAEIMLNNSASLLRRNSGIDQPLYTNDIVDMVIHTLHPIGFRQEVDLTINSYNSNNPIYCELFEAGHILGAASILLKTKDLKIYYTGDISINDQSIIPGAVLPKGPIDILIMESTITGSNEDNFQTEELLIERFVKNLNSVFTRGGSVLIPTFALGKTQEMLALLNSLIVKNIIPPVDLYSGNMSRDISRIYDNFRYTTKRVNSDIELKEIPQRSFPEKLLQGEYFNKQSIILAPSGMVDKGTTSYELAKAFIKNKKNAIFFVGYVDPDSPGYQIYQSITAQTSYFMENDSYIPIDCTVKRFRFSSHARKEQLLQIIKKLSPKKLVLVHGDYENQLQFSKEIQEIHKGIEIIIPEDGITYEF